MHTQSINNEREREQHSIICTLNQSIMRERERERERERFACDRGWNTEEKRRKEKRSHTVIALLTAAASPICVRSRWNMRSSRSTSILRAATKKRASKKEGKESERVREEYKKEREKISEKRRWQIR